VLTALLIMLREGFEAALFLIAVATTEDGWAVLVGGWPAWRRRRALGALVVCSAAGVCPCASSSPSPA
jgi:hypothetical protein